MIFIDSNVPMYLVGRGHPNRERARELLEGLIARGERLVSDAEVLQEILHRYTAIRRRDAIQPAFDVLLELSDEVFPVLAEDVLSAYLVTERQPGLSARDAIHVALMRRLGIDRILSFDAGFDHVGGLTRLA